MRSTIIILTLLISSVVLNAQNLSTEKFFRQLSYNHVSPHVPILGAHEIDRKEAQNTSHYIFKFDKEDRLAEIINNHYHTEKIHHLTTLGAYRTVFEYGENLETRTYYDKNNKRITNERRVYKEIYKTNKRGFKTELEFYDLKDEPMESAWAISRYEWKSLKRFVVEQRFNLKNEAVNVSPYFEFGTTGIVYNKAGLVKAHYNLNEDFRVLPNSAGLASYQDTYDVQGNHIRYTYHDENNTLIKNQWGFSVGEKGYDKMGNYISLTLYDENEKVISKRPIYSNSLVQLASIAVQNDSIEIKEMALGYLVALQEMKPELMKRVMNGGLNKVTPGFNPAKKEEEVRETTYEQMVEFAKSWNKQGNKFPHNPKNQVFILDIYDRMATVKLVSDNWVEYLHLVKLNKEWSIINLLWQQKDTRRYPSN